MFFAQTVNRTGLPSLRDSLSMSDQGPRLVIRLDLSGCYTYVDNLGWIGDTTSARETFASESCERSRNVGLRLHEINRHGAVGEVRLVLGGN